MRALKALVIGMGILILIGFAAVVMAMIERAGEGGGDGPSSVRSGVPAERVFGDLRVKLPPGAQVIGTSADGGRLIVHLRLAGGEARILVIDLATGKRLGAIEFAPSATAPGATTRPRQRP